MNSLEKFPQWGMNLIIFIPHWGIFTHIMAKFAWDVHRKTQQITPEICQFAFAQAENLTKKWENMQKSWRKTLNRCKRKRKNMWATCPKTWNGGKKQAFLAAQIGGGQKWAPHLFRLKSIFYKNAKKQNFLPFLNSYYYQNCCRADSFQHLYINNARKVR